MTTSYTLQLPGFAARSTWGYDELNDLLLASVVPDSAGECELPLKIDAVTIDQLLDRIDTATSGRFGMASLIILLSRLEVRGQARVWLASRIRFITDQTLLAEAARSDVPWVSAEARNHPLFDEPMSATCVCPACGRSHTG
ncbi:hypothetical protein [Leifsonia sp. 2MCAF36]|uniref:hypothetical protein n=1 Tax=Leifsonia sp. 2MCAF36 TaxID=3232988 RepID=UPI003F9D63DB